MGYANKKGSRKRKSNRKRKHFLRSRRRRRNLRANKKPIAYGHVYSTQCGHCINMQEDWDKLKNEANSKNKTMELIDISENHQAKVDEMNQTYQTDLKFSGFPTIFKVMSKSSPVHYYQGDRSKEDMKKWLFS